VDPLDSFAARLRESRQAKGLSQEELADRSGLHLTAVGRIERAEREPGIRTVYKLARALGLKPAELFEGME
jgi:transcriptional regulator with XRE-family HTH domain